MSTDWILWAALITAVLALVAVRVTFRKAASVREAMFSPMVFGMCGGLLGISIGMLCLAEKDGKVDIEKGFFALVCGGGVGAVAGGAARDGYSSMNRGKNIVFVLVTVLLAISICSPVGWVVGDVRARSDYEAGDLRTRYMIWGAAFGSGLGCLLGLSELVFRRRGVT